MEQNPEASDAQDNKPSERDNALAELESAVQSISKAIHFAYRGSAEHGSFLVNTGTEFVPCAFMSLNRLHDALAKLKNA